VTREARVAAQAKVNLALRVLARESSGYHQLETLFLRLALADDVVVRVGVRGRSLDVRGADLGAPERNLAWRAAVAYGDATGWPEGFAVEVEKRIPVGGGLGGGSADAAAVLRALDALSPRPLGAGGVLALAGALGSDVPFLAGDRAYALAWGRGERLLALPTLPERAAILVVPPFGVATGEAYGWLAAERGDASPFPWTHDARVLATWDGAASISANDFEGPVFARHPALRAALDVLRALPGVAVARMSGSGSTLFGILGADDEASGRPVALPRDWGVVRTRTASRVSSVTTDAR
jgi:4-diphosphocytidyl-2-C-methyl-D-erythritol kinase